MRHTRPQLCWDPQSSAAHYALPPSYTHTTLTHPRTPVTTLTKSTILPSIGRAVLVIGQVQTVHTDGAATVCGTTARTATPTPPPLTTAK